VARLSGRPMNEDFCASKWGLIWITVREKKKTHITKNIRQKISWTLLRKVSGRTWRERIDEGVVIQGKKTRRVPPKLPGEKEEDWGNI